MIRIIRLAQLGKLYKQINQTKIENIQKEFEAQKETKNLERQNSFQNHPKPLARIHPEPSQPPLTTQGHEDQRLLTKNDERLDTDMGETAPVIKQPGKTATLLFLNNQPIELEESIKKSAIMGRRSQGENQLSINLLRISKQEISPENENIKTEQEEEIPSQPFKRKKE